MKRLYCALHDAWCELTKKCRNAPQIAQTPMIEWLKEQEHEANQSAELIRRRRTHDLSIYLSAPERRDRGNERQ